MSTSHTNPARADVWRVNLEPVIGHEQGRTRPAVIVSVDLHNQGPAGMLVIVPMTTAVRPHPWRVRIDPPEGGCTEPSDLLCDQVRAISKRRLAGASPMGSLAPATMARIEDRLRILLAL